MKNFIVREAGKTLSKGGREGGRGEGRGKKTRREKVRLNQCVLGLRSRGALSAFADRLVILLPCYPPPSSQRPEPNPFLYLSLPLPLLLSGAVTWIPPTPTSAHLIDQGEVEVFALKRLGQYSADIVPAEWCPFLGRAD